MESSRGRTKEPSSVAIRPSANVTIAKWVAAIEGLVRKEANRSEPA